MKRISLTAKRSYSAAVLLVLLLPFGGRSGGGFAATYCGRVTNAAGEPLPYATVYPINDPVSGTATNNDGYFSFETYLAPGSEIVISYIGYEKTTLREEQLRCDSLSADSGLTAEGGLTAQRSVVLKEQPIDLAEMVVSAKQPKYANKRKQMALLLQAVYEQLESDLPTTPTAYHLVSDVRMDSEGKPWGVEQMIATCVTLPDSLTAEGGLTAKRSYSDSGPTGEAGPYRLQFHAETCKRFFAPSIRRLADSIYTTDILEQMGSQTRKAATAIDSGVVVHKGLFAAGQVKQEFAESMSDLRHWSVNRENDSLTVLTYSVKKTAMLIFKIHYTAHYIVDSRTLGLLRMAQMIKMDVTIPFGIKLDAGQLALLNMLNLSERQIDRFRLRQVHALIHFNTLYTSIGNKRYILEKNLHTTATIVGARKQVIPLDVNATQRMTSILPDAEPLTPNQLTRRLHREIVEIY